MILRLNWFERLIKAIFNALIGGKLDSYESELKREITIVKGLKTKSPIVFAPIEVSQILNDVDLKKYIYSVFLDSRWRYFIQQARESLIMELEQYPNRDIGIGKLAMIDKLMKTMGALGEELQAIEEQKQNEQ